MFRYQTNTHFHKLNLNNTINKDTVLYQCEPHIFLNRSIIEMTSQTSLPQFNQKVKSTTTIKLFNKNALTTLHHKNEKNTKKPFTCKSSPTGRWLISMIPGIASLDLPLAISLNSSVYSCGCEQTHNMQSALTVPTCLHLISFWISITVNIRLQLHATTTF